LCDNFSVEIKKNLAEFEAGLVETCAKFGRERSEIKLIAVTKNRSAVEINELLASGIRAIGENRLQEFLTKKSELDNCEKHFIGRIQSNKAREIACEFDVIESVSSLKIAKILNDSITSRDVARNVSTTTLPIFLQVNLSREEQKDGFLAEDLEIAVEAVHELPHLELEGLMTIGVLGDPEKTRAVFQECKALCDKLGFAKFSAGMTDDWQLAVECGATELRIGRRFFE